MQVKRIALLGISLLYCYIELFAQDLEGARARLFDDTGRGLHILDSILLKTPKTDANTILGAHLLYSEYYYSSSIYDSCLVYTDSAIKYCQIVEDSLNIGRMLNRKGIIYDEQGQYAAAMDYYLQSLIVREKINDELGLSSSFNNLGILNQNLGLNEKALGYYKEALRIRRRLDDQRGAASTLVNLGGNFGEMNETDSALKCFETALEFYLKVEDSTRIANCYNNIGYIWDDRGAFEKAIDFYLKAKEIKEAENDLRYLATTYINLSAAYLNQGQYQQSLYYSEKALAKGNELNMKIDAMDGALLASKASEALNEHDKSLQYMKTYLAIKDELYGVESLQRITELQERSSAANAEFRSRERNLREELMTSKDNLKIWKYLFFFGLVSIGFLLFRQFSLKKSSHHEPEENSNERHPEPSQEMLLKIKQLEREILKLENASRRDKVFFKNVIQNLRSESGSLQGLANLVKRGNIDQQEEYLVVKNFSVLASRIDLMIEKLVTIELMEQDKSSLENIDLKELVDSSLSKFRDQIEASEIMVNLTLDQKPEIVSKRLMLSIMLDNVIENAVHFGKKKPNQKGFSIEIKIRKTLQDGFQIDVIDEGVGIKKEALNRIFDPFFKYGSNENGSGLGLYIARLAARAINAEIKVESIYTKFTHISMHIPKQA